ncbi:FHA domain-containing protein [Streptomyces sp. E5N91]|uniref:FHA domain-containing protein n=1 Tax=Streptomyces sp. E5N91 TaxID=1851996 RepID=UPI00187D53ED|nr:FHA domain-containing protein [Streptomyces sp. E5N91]
MYSIIVVPPPTTEEEDTGTQYRLAPGERLVFGRSVPGGGLRIGHDGVSRRAGEIAAHGTFWTLSNLSAHQTYVVENPEGAGEHIKVAPGRVDAPVPFELSRVTLPAAGDLLSFDVWAPRHAFRSVDRRALDGTGTVPAFALDRTKRYFAVLAALCERRLRGEPRAPLPAVEEIVERLRPSWPKVSRSAVYWNIDYLAVKLRLRPGPEAAGPGQRTHGKKESLASLALRFDLVREDDLLVLAPVASRAER